MIHTLFYNIMFGYEQVQSLCIWGNGVFLA